MKYTNTTLKALTTQARLNREIIDFDYVSRDELAKVLKELKELNINAFTISEASSALMDCMSFFTANGFKVSNIIQIDNFNEWDRHTIPAVLFERV